jgi:predicted transcriptional regulator
MKTLAIRLEDDLHAQLAVLAQLSELTVTDAIRQAIEQWIEQKRSAPELTTRAQSVLDEIERDAAQRRLAIATLFGETAEPAPKTTTETEQPSSRRAQRGKGGEAVADS